MFDVAFSELLVIGVVALVVIGPEKLPKVARTLGLLAGRMQRYVNTVKADIQREMQFQDLQKLQSEIQESVNAVRSGIQEAGQNILHQVNEVQQAIETPTQPPALETVNEVVESDGVKEIVSDPTITNADIEMQTENTKATSEANTQDKKVAADSSTKTQAKHAPTHPQAQLPLEPPPQ